MPQAKPPARVGRKAAGLFETAGLSVGRSTNGLPLKAIGGTVDDEKQQIEHE